MVPMAVNHQVTQVVAVVVVVATMAVLVVQLTHLVMVLVQVVEAVRTMEQPFWLVLVPLQETLAMLIADHLPVTVAALLEKVEMVV